uniref:Uncharacterized protein n=1 Tax=Rhizophora mucronata TaxID=61149 RepID=A0A2P2P8F1_RHIMU
MQCHNRIKSIVILNKITNQLIISCFVLLHKHIPQDNERGKDNITADHMLTKRCLHIQMQERALPFGSSTRNQISRSIPSNSICKHSLAY